MDRNIQEKLKYFFRSYPIRFYKKGEMIIREGDPFVKIFYIKSGFVRLYLLTKNGRELSLLLYPPGNYFPTLLELSKDESEYYFEAGTDLKLYAAPKEKFLEFIKKSPSVMYDMSVRGGVMVRRLLKRIKVFSTESPYIRTVTMLSFLYRFYKEFGNSTDHHDITICHQELSTWIHTSRETVSRQLEKLERKGIVKCTKGKIRILNFAELRNEI
jgi:CRP-like cAMP-binding protein